MSSEQWLVDSPPGTLVLVTHAVAVGRLTGSTLQQAEMIVLRPAPGDPRGGGAVGRIAPPPGTP